MVDGLVIESIIIMFFFMFISMLIYFKIPVNYAIRRPLNIVNFGYSVIIMPLLFAYEIPTTPFIQIYFLIFQAIFFIFINLEYLRKRDVKK